jgi:hypothetical protein
LETLASILEARNAIAFVGAGASAPMYPLWGKFIELLADHAVAEGKAEELVRIRRAMVPVMTNVSAAIAQSDCLFYAMQKR